MSTDHDYLTSGELAHAMHVSPKTILRWANQGRIPYIITLGGHRRFLRSDVDSILAEMHGAPAAEQDRPPPPGRGD
jgi:excisionase family DNA binding protein